MLALVTLKAYYSNSRTNEHKNMLRTFIQKFFIDARYAGFELFAISAFMLGFALISQFGFGYAPCELCIMQRWPYVAIGIIGIIALFIGKSRPKVAAAFIALAGGVFLTGMGIAIFHVGVEQKWWAGLKTCSQPSFMNDNLSLDDLEAMIMAAPVVSCGDIAWTLFGLSMAVYNALLSFVYALYSIVAAIFITRKANGL